MRRGRRRSGRLRCRRRPNGGNASARPRVRGAWSVGSRPHSPWRAGDGTASVGGDSEKRRAAVIGAGLRAVGARAEWARGSASGKGLREGMKTMAEKKKIALAAAEPAPRKAKPKVAGASKKSVARKEKADGEAKLRAPKRSGAAPKKRAKLSVVESAGA